ncbi:MAG TPA: hypothetical protein VMZ30_08725, partial [Pyrinomonadaceae bacterium]|nr:hypothetical protein [Pyrinomonadaceae bacterium]
CLAYSGPEGRIGQIVALDPNGNQARLIYSSGSNRGMPFRMMMSNTNTLYIVEDATSTLPPRVFSIDIANVSAAPATVMELPRNVDFYVGKSADGRLIGFIYDESQTAVTMFIADLARRSIEYKAFPRPFTPTTDLTFAPDGYIYGGMAENHQFESCSIYRFRLQDTVDNVLRIRKLTNTEGVSITLDGTTQSSFRLQITTDLARKLWTTLGPITTSRYGVGSYEDRDVQNSSRRYYRAVSP